MPSVFKFDDPSLGIDLSSPLDITIPIRKTGNVNCYYLDDPNFTYFESPEFSGNLSKGGSVNCEKISLYPHASGTHTECALHVAAVQFDMRHVVLKPVMLAFLVSIMPVETEGDKVITLDQLKAIQRPSDCEAIIVRTIPNSEEKCHHNYSSTNPPYFEPAALTFLRETGFKHLLTDLPSIDRESDEGRLAAHKNWFLENGVATPERTITELIFVPEKIKDGYYGLSIMAPSLETDAVPSRILLYPCV
jgi:kynurenine formamidase